MAPAHSTQAGDGDLELGDGHCFYWILVAEKKERRAKKKMDAEPTTMLHLENVFFLTSFQP